ncbi:MAG TPA: DUF3397 domain-containing protein [Candidatus Tetragenococcus pullicola]|nr:DUF3397 domain-containing protein [Candidatus Tetragenococcus pullicola]
MHTFTPVLIFWYLFPILAIFASQLILAVFSLKKRFHLKAADFATVLLLFGIHKLSVITLGTTIFPYFLITLFLLGIGLTFFQAYFYDELDFRRFFKMYWRSVFLLSLALYIVLILLSILSFF